jgi:hypothetical protein
VVPVPAAARHDLLAAAGPAVVHGPVSGEPGADEVEGVAGVAVRARRANRLAAVAAGGEDLPLTLDQHGAVAVEDPGGAGEPDGGGAAAGGLDLGAPGAGVGGRGAGRCSRPRREHWIHLPTTDEIVTPLLCCACSLLSGPSLFRPPRQREIAGAELESRWSARLNG